MGYMTMFTYAYTLKRLDCGWTDLNIRIVRWIMVKMYIN